MWIVRPFSGMSFAACRARVCSFVGVSKFEVVASHAWKREDSVTIRIVARMLTTCLYVVAILCGRARFGCEIVECEVLPTMTEPGAHEWRVFVAVLLLEMRLNLVAREFDTAVTAGDAQELVSLGSVDTL
jgi:hypothetical protein